MVKFADIPKMTRDGHYRTNVPWDHLERHISRWIKEGEDSDTASLELCPDFQRGHVWTREQQIAYVEFKLRGGMGSHEIRFNCAGWMGDFRGPFVLVDGLQRLTAVRKFLNNEIPAFGHFLHEYEDPRELMNIDFVFSVNDVSDYNDVLKWYVEMNSGGVVHTEEEINRVKDMIKD